MNYSHVNDAISTAVLTGLVMASTSLPVMFREALAATVWEVLENSAITVFKPGV